MSSRLALAPSSCQRPSVGLEVGGYAGEFLGEFLLQRLEQRALERTAVVGRARQKHLNEMHYRRRPARLAVSSGRAAALNSAQGSERSVASRVGRFSTVK